MPEAVHVRRTRWTRTHTIWALILLSLMPGVVIALFRDQWLELPAGMKGAVYLVSTILIVAACSLIITRRDTERQKPESDL
jgi:undecaprenyl pyrophosphate phosphatase UppP